uniref:Truncated RNA polymerase n=1 Tax=Sclerotinia borealis TaxID=77105 RepID=A0A088CB08_9HELO|nr:truncated RNA polymerase [Sclerotinia borealis]AHX82988.1 truncated RNA polymerase [Sclerotinia borealis]
MYVLKDIDTTLVLCVIMSKCIPFTIKYENVEDQPVTKLFNTTGSVLLWEAQLQHYKNDIKDGLIANSDYKFSDYIKDTKILLDEDERIALGCCDFIFFFRERSNLFVVKDVKVKKDLRRRIILPKSDLKHPWNNVRYLDSEELPLIINPLQWKINNGDSFFKFKREACLSTRCHPPHHR